MRAAALDAGNQYVPPEPPPQNLGVLDTRFAHRSLTRQEHDAALNSVTSSQHTKLTVMPNHALNCEGELEGFVFECAAEDSASVLPISKSSFVTTAIYECLQDNGSSFLELTTNMSATTAKLREMMENIESRDNETEHLKFDCMPELDASVDSSTCSWSGFFLSQESLNCTACVYFKHTSFKFDMFYFKHTSFKFDMFLEWIALVRLLFRTTCVPHLREHLCLLAGKLLQKKEVCNKAGTYASHRQRSDVIQEWFYAKRDFNIWCESNAVQVRDSLLAALRQKTWIFLVIDHTAVPLSLSEIKSPDVRIETQMFQSACPHCQAPLHPQKRRREADTQDGFEDIV
jgi:hypothetical protein